jgi:uncharacterized protein (TIGR00297 family)
MGGRPHSEDARKLVHIGFGVCAFFLRDLSWRGAALIALSALVFNVVAMPRVGAIIYRPADRSRVFAHGVVLYPLAVLLLILIFPGRPDIAAAAWGILALGDGMSSVLGRRFGRRRVPWNREKSIYGSVALFLCGGAAGAVLAWWCRPALATPPPMWFSLGAPFVASLVAALVETIPIRLDDNLSVPGSAALVLWALSLVSGDRAAAFARESAWLLPAALAVNAAAAWAGYRAGTVTGSGAICGAAIGATVAAAAGWSGWGVLVATFLAAAISSRLGVQRKTLLGIAEERGGRRGAGNAIANTGFAAGAALIAALSPASSSALIAFTAALAAGGGDTVASEIGKAWGSRTFLITSMREVQPGTSGGMSIEGTIAGLAGAFVIGALAVVLGLIPAGALLAVVIGATIGSMAESALAVAFEAKGVLNNDTLNFLNTAIAAAAAIGVAALWP